MINLISVIAVIVLLLSVPFGIFFIISLLLKRSFKEMLKDIFDAIFNVFS